MHPAVGRLRDAQLAEAKRRGDAVVISDIPLLFEVGLEHAFDGVILVDAPEPVRLARLQRSGWAFCAIHCAARSAIERRMKS